MKKNGGGGERFLPYTQFKGLLSGFQCPGDASQAFILCVWMQGNALNACKTVHQFVHQTFPIGKTGWNSLSCEGLPSVTELELGPFALVVPQKNVETVLLQSLRIQAQIRL